MIVRPSSSATRLAVVVAAVVFAAALSFFSVRNARAAHYADTATLPGYEKAVQLEPTNARNWYLLGRYWQYNREQPDAQRAIAAYRTSLALDPHAVNAWLDLATSYQRESNVQSARESFLQAKKAYPFSAEVASRYGNFFLRQNELPESFAEIRQAVYVDPRRGGEAFSRCGRVDPSVSVAEACTLAAVGPGTTYRLSAWIPTQALASDQGVRLRVSWIENSRGDSIGTLDLHDTEPWTKTVAPLWTAGRDVHSAQICVVRYPSGSRGSRIRGSAWIDDVALVPEGAEQARP
jgi:Tfp pilus assembly protein PilF